ncbi:AAA family ATPase [Roseomonas soli]|uniref:AAA family ATPase n=2 Tax=Neoroseomonas soli TaxID=1081025 RepID=A0A9X9WSN8_9PROT|nr:AAA family ATPase [Neoroseomonas soli]
MQIDAYGFRSPPFQMTPDVRLYFPSTVHSRAYAHLLFGLAQREGFVVVTGEVGAGKTTLIERLCAELAPTDHVIARIMTTQVEADDLLRLVATAFGAPSHGSKAEILRSLIAVLGGGVHDLGKRPVLIVDEAQGLPISALEELRMLTNVTEGDRALLQVILMGQPQLRRTLARPDLDQLRQRILAAYHLAGLTREETHLYVRHRMSAVGWTGHPAWDEAALDTVHHHTGGIPRRINRLCSRVLLAGSLEHQALLSAALVEATAVELEQDLNEICADPLPSPPLTLPEAPAAAPASTALEEAIHDLGERVGELERLTTKRERVFRRLQDLFGDVKPGRTRR